MASTAEYYRKNPKAKAKRLKQQKAYMKGKGREIRLEADRLSADLPGGKVGDGLDASHCGGKITGFVKASKNRGKKGEGGRKKGVKHNYPKNRKSPSTGTRKSRSTGKRK